MGILDREALVTVAAACLLQVQEDGCIHKGMRIEVALCNLQRHTVGVGRSASCAHSLTASMHLATPAKAVALSPRMDGSDVVLQG